MAVKDTNVAKTAKFAREIVKLTLGTSATSQTGKRVDAFTPGYPFEVIGVEVYALTVTATISVDVQIGSTSVLASAITPVADTPTAGTLATSVSSRRGLATDIVSFKYTSNGTGAATNCYVQVTIRPRPLNGEV